MRLNEQPPSKFHLVMDTESYARRANLTEAATVRGMDFFQWCARARQRFAKIAANPPYVAIP